MTEHEMHRGKGQTMQERGEELAFRKRVAMLTRTDRIHPLLSLNDEQIAKLDRLTKGLRLPLESDIRLDPNTGDLYDTRWGNVATIINPETGKLTTSTPEDHTNLTGYATVLPNPDELIRKRPAKRIIFNWNKGLEDAIRKQLHIMGGSDPSSMSAEPQQLMKLQFFGDQLRQAFREGLVSKKRLDQYNQEVRQLLDEANLFNAVDEDKKKIAEMYLKATTPDSQGRVNSMKSQTQLNSADISITERLVTTEFNRQKSSANLRVLVAERHRTRSALEQAYDELDSIEQLFAHDLVSVADRQKLQSRIDSIAKTFLPISRVRPYLPLARTAAILLRGCRKERRENNRITLGDETADLLFSLAPATFLLGDGDSEEAGYESIGGKDRIALAGVRVRLAKEVVRKALDAKEHNNLTPSDKKAKAKKPAKGTIPLNGNDDPSKVIPESERDHYDQDNATNEGMPEFIPFNAKEGAF